MAEHFTMGTNTKEAFRLKLRKSPFPSQGTMLRYSMGKQKDKKSENITTLLKSESFLFARLYVACQTRDGDTFIQS